MEMQTIDHYILEVEGVAPMLVKTTSATVHTLQERSSYRILIRAVDECGQRGQALVTDESPGATSSNTGKEQPSNSSGAEMRSGTEMHSGAKKGNYFLQ